jgi:Domain of unknown function (DUF4331)
VNVLAMSRWRLGMVGVLACLSVADASAPTSPRATAADSGLADIQAVYAWMDSDATRLNLAMTVSPFDAGTTMFGPGIQYVFHVQALRTPTSTDGGVTFVICEFAAPEDAQCWVGTEETPEKYEYLSGNPLSTSGISNPNGTIRVFAGRRSDAFFFNSAGFGAALAQARVAASAAATNAAGCPAITPSAAAAIVQQFSRRPPPNQTQPGEDRFGSTNVLALVVQVNKKLLRATSFEPIFAVWGSTHKR